MDICTLEINKRKLFKFRRMSNDLSYNITDNKTANSN
jgi:hypothetical protein